MLGSQVVGKRQGAWDVMVALGPQLITASHGLQSETWKGEEALNAPAEEVWRGEG